MNPNNFKIKQSFFFEAACELSRVPFEFFEDMDILVMVSCI